MRGLTLAGLVAVVGCAANPVPPEYYSGIVKKLAPKKGAMVTSGCVARDELGQDFVMTDPSDAHAQLWQKTATPYLAAYGLPLAAEPIRMTCGGYQAAPNDKVFFVPTKETIAQATAAVFPRVVGGTLDAETAQNVNALLAEVDKAAVTTMSRKKGGPTRPKLKLAPGRLEQLRTGTGADYLWVLATHENEISAGKAVGTAVLTAVLSLGTVATVPTGGRSNTIALVDLNDATIVWKKIEGNAHGQTTTSMTGTAAAPNYQTTQTHAVADAGADQIVAARLFEPLLPIGQGLAGKGTAPPAADAAVDAGGATTTTQ